MTYRLEMLENDYPFKETWEWESPLGLFIISFNGVACNFYRVDFDRPFNEEVELVRQIPLRAI